jgi:hypothetical protein
MSARLCFFLIERKAKQQRGNPGFKGSGEEDIHMRARDVPIKATQATPTKLSRRSRSGRWEGALVFVDEEEGVGEEGLSPAPEGAAIWCRPEVFIVLSPEVGAAAGGKARDQHLRKILGFGCGKGVREGGVSRGKARCGAPPQQNHSSA